MSLAQRMHFLLDVFQMTGIALASLINHYHIIGLYLFWDTLYYTKLSKCQYLNISAHSTFALYAEDFNSKCKKPFKKIFKP